MFDLTGKTALVTGATGTIGGSIARALHAQGATVAISGTRVDALNQLGGELGGRVHVLPCNLADAAAFETAARAIPGVVGTGLFLAMADIVLVGDPDDNFRFLEEKRRSP